MNRFAHIYTSSISEHPLFNVLHLHLQFSYLANEISLYDKLLRGTQQHLAAVGLTR